MEQHVRPDVRFGVVENFLLRTEAHELLKHPAAALVLRAGVELAVGKRACAALAELDVALGVQRSAAPEALDLFPAQRCGVAALEHEGPQPRLRQHEGGEHACRAEADDHGPLRCGAAGNMVDIWRLPRDLCAAAAAQHGPLAAAERDVHGVDPAEVRLFAGVKGAAENVQRSDVRCADMQGLRRMIIQLGDVVRLRQDQVTNAKHGVPSR